MAKFGNFISKNYFPISEEEKQEFVKRISTLVEKYDNTLKINVSYKIDGMLFISFTADKTRKFRNVSKSRISFNGISLIINKTDGYLENFDWCKMEVKDKTKPEKDYESAPPFQYSAAMWVKGEEIPYRCSTGRDIANTEMYQYGTEFDDIDFSSALWKLFNQELKPMEK